MGTNTSSHSSFHHVERGTNEINVQVNISQSALIETIQIHLVCNVLSPLWPPTQTAVWVNFFFWLIIGALVIFQRRQSTRSKLMAGGYGGPAGGLFGEPGLTAAETEPFFNRPARPQWGWVPQMTNTFLAQHDNMGVLCERCGKRVNAFSVQWTLVRVSGFPVNNNLFGIHCVCFRV